VNIEMRWSTRLLRTHAQTDSPPVVPQHIPKPAVHFPDALQKGAIPGVFHAEDVRVGDIEHLGALLEQGVPSTLVVAGDEFDLPVQPMFDPVVFEDVDEVRLHGEVGSHQGESTRED
jgi:hypothetical protein